MIDHPPTRRRALAIVASTAATAVLSDAPRLADGRLEWRGTALGADASIILEGAPAGADGVLRDCLVEIERLEGVFSLHRPGSELARLNADGYTRTASLELREVLAHSRTIHHITSGRFDPTVQPLWLYFAGLGTASNIRAEIDPDEVAQRLSLIGLDRVRVENGHVTLAAGAALTFNGIAQGYITDRIVALLKQRGFRHVLADIGEVRAIGGRADGTSFRIAIVEGGWTIALADAALATSSADALVLSPGSDVKHILDPRTGSSVTPWRAVTVGNPSAALADAMSTALALAGADDIASAVAALPRTTAWAFGRDGAVNVFGATGDKVARS